MDKNHPLKITLELIITALIVYLIIKGDFGNLVGFLILLGLIWIGKWIWKRIKKKQ